MKHALYTAAGFVLLASAYSHARPASCFIHDASGMPVNVRSSPDGGVLGQLKNGTAVKSDLSAVGSWVYISWDKPALNNSNSGWIYRSFIRCN